MNVALIYLNPNISKNQADEIYSEHMERRSNILNGAIDAADKIKDPKQRSEYLNAIALVAQII